MRPVNSPSRKDIDLTAEQIASGVVIQRGFAKHARGKDRRGHVVELRLHPPGKHLYQLRVAPALQAHRALDGINDAARFRFSALESAQTPLEQAPSELVLDFDATGDLIK